MTCTTASSTSTKVTTKWLVLLLYTWKGQSSNLSLKTGFCERHQYRHTGDEALLTGSDVVETVQAHWWYSYTDWQWSGTEYTQAGNYLYLQYLWFVSLHCE